MNIINEIEKKSERPWGNYEVIAQGKEYKSKVITVKPKQRLSLQKHLHRSEHWVVVVGKALVRLDDKEITLLPNNHVYIEKEQWHRITNIGDENLIFIEVQYGKYLGEDDIIRSEDDYQRL